MAQSTDLTTGSITKKLLAVATPIMGSQLVQMTYNLTDMFWLGQTKESTLMLAASGLGGMFMWLSMALMTFGRMGAEIGVSQSVGRGETTEAERYACAAVRIALYLGLLFGGALMAFTPMWIGLFGVREPEVHQAAVSYLRIAAIGIPLTYVSAAVTGVFNGAGNTRLTFICNAVGMVLNMILDPLMIIVWGWGIAGAAIATVIGQAAVCVLFMVCVRKHGQRPLPGFRFRGRMERTNAVQILRWAWPTALENGAFTLLAMSVTNMVAQYSASAITVQRIGSQIESLSWLIGGGFGTAVTAFVGQNFGARRFDRIRAGFRTSLTWLCCWQAFVTFVLFFFGGTLYKAFSGDVNIQMMGSTYLKILCSCVIFGAFEGVCAGSFRGMGQTLPASICSIGGNLVRPVLCWVLSRQMGLNGLWWGVAISAMLRGVTVAIWYMVAARQMPTRAPVEV